MTTRSQRKAYSYLRFSTPDQMRGDSFRRQTELARQYAAKNNLQLDDKLTFRDLGVSAYQGKNAQTGQLAGFREAVRSGLVEPGSYLLVEHLDRISRREVGHALRLLQDICSEGITVVTLSDGREYTADNVYTDVVSIIIALLTFAGSHEESAKKASRLKAAWEGKREQIEETPLTTQVPGWLTVNGRMKVGKHMRGGTLKIIPERAAVVRRIFKMALKGAGQNAIAETLNREHVPVFGRGKHWHRSYISKLLSSSTVIGTLTPHVFEHKGGKRNRKPLDPVTDYYPAVVEEKDFRRVQSLRQGKAPLRGRHATNGHVRNLFGGLALCPKCNGTMTLVYKGEPPKGGTYLACAKAKAGAGCTYRAVRYGPIEEAFLRDSKRLLNTVPAGNGGKGIDKELENVETLLLELPEQIDNLLTAIQKDQRKGMSSAAMTERLHALEVELEQTRGRQTALLQQQSEVAGALVNHKVEDLEEALSREPLNRVEVNALLRQLLTNVIVDYTSGQLVLQWRHGGESEVIFAWPKGRTKPKPKPSRKGVLRKRSR